MELNTSTALAAEQEAHLKKSLGRFDIVFLLIAAIVGLETLGAGLELRRRGVHLDPGPGDRSSCALRPDLRRDRRRVHRGGRRLHLGAAAFGRPARPIASLLSWVTQPIWVGGSMVFLATEAWNTYSSDHGLGSFLDYAFKLIFVWITVLAAIVSLAAASGSRRRARSVKVLSWSSSSVTAVVYGAQHGFAGLVRGDFCPTWSASSASTPMLLFAYLGFESATAPPAR